MGTDGSAGGCCVACGGAVAEGRCSHCGAAQAPGGYRVERVLAQTAHSRMYVATAPDGRRVALKELVFALVPGAQELDAFAREAAVLQDLDVAGVPRFVASFQEGAGVGTRLYLAQEYVEGESLAERLRRGRLDEESTLDVARQVLAILEGLQRRRPVVVHRDVKPANLVLRPDGRIALVDFGAARLLQGDATFRSTLVGTFGYMPPEQLGGTVDATADLYALGATLVHLLTGVAPADLADHAGAIDVGQLVTASRPLRQWLAGLLAPVRERRFPSAAAALEALRSMDAPKAEPWPRRVRVTAAATVLFLAASIGSLLVLDAIDEPARPTVARRTAPPRAAPAPRKPPPAPPEDTAPVEVVSLERLLAPGRRAAFWIEKDIFIYAPGQRHDPFEGWMRTSQRSLPSCDEAPAAWLWKVEVTLPSNITSGAQLRVRTLQGRDPDDCQFIRMRLRSEDGHEMRSIEGLGNEWIILRHLPRYVLSLGPVSSPVEVLIDLQARRLVLPGTGTSPG